MNLVSINDVSKNLNDTPLFSGVSFGIDDGDHIGFVGPNGSGKSTFLSLITGNMQPDTGTMARSRELTVSVLEQRPRFLPGTTVRSFLYAGEDPLLTLIGEYERCLEAAEKNTSGSREELARLTQRMEERGGFGAEHTYQSLLTELGIADMDAPMETLSGGMVKKAAIARAFTAGSRLLLLDEPTNHLDIETIEWLEKKLKDASFSFILVTHDRYFLDAVCTVILDIDRRAIHKYEGNYSSFLRRKAERIEEEERHGMRREAILSVELEWLKRGPKARALKDSHRKERIQTMLNERQEDPGSMERFDTASRRLGGRILELSNVSKAWDGQTVISSFSHIFSRGERAGIIGPNGSGKSTFLDLIYGKIEGDGGIVERGVNTVMGYFDQTAAEINKNQTVLDFILEKARHIMLKDGTLITAEQFLERFMFPRSMFPLSLSRLSGGELRRLQLIRILSSSPNFLLLDEPTNDFDIETISLLEDFLEGFSGCLLVVSHDRAFLNRVTDFLFVFDGTGNIIHFTGNYADYRELQTQNEKEASSAEKRLAAVPAKTADTADSGGHSEKSKKLSFKEQKEFDALLSEISELEEEKSLLEASFLLYKSGAQDNSGSSGTHYKEVCVFIEQKTLRWEELAERA